MPTKDEVLRSFGISYLKRIFRISQAPVFISYFFTRKCNMNCTYCSASNRSSAKDISVDEWKYYTDVLYNVGCRHFTIYGGEPTLRTELPDLVEHCTKSGAFTQVVTNGSLLTEDLIKDLVKHGYFVLSLSVDSYSGCSASEKKYDFELIELLSEIKKRNPSKIDFFFHTVITRENLNQVGKLINAINEQFTECRFSLDPVHSSIYPNEKYRYRSYCPQLKLEKQEMSDLIEMIRDLKRKDIDIWGTKRYYQYMDKWYQDKYSWRCDAGDYYYSVNNDGTMMLCEEIPTKITFAEFHDLPRRKRINLIRKYMFDGCECFKPCYWIPTDLIKHPISSFLSKYKT